MLALRLLSVAAVLAATSFAHVGAALAQGAPPAGQNPHHPPAQGQAAPAPGSAMPMPGGAGGMGMMGMMGGGGMSHMGGMMDHMSMMQMMGERTEGRLAFIKAELAITDTQLPAWNAYADAVRAEAKRRTGGMPMGHAAVPAATWIDRLTRQEQDLEQRLESLRRLKGVSSALYATLSATQKKTADEVLGGPMGRM